MRLLRCDMVNRSQRANAPQVVRRQRATAKVDVCADCAPTLSERMIFSANRIPLRRIMRWVVAVRAARYQASPTHIAQSHMSKLSLSVAIGDYDRNRPLIDGAVHIDGVDPVFMTLSPEEIFFRALRTQDFDICELSLSSFTVKTAAGDSPYVGVPCFLSRAFRHTSIYVRTDRIKKPKDLKGAQGRRAGISTDRQRVGARDPGRRPRRQARGHPLDPRRHRGCRPASRRSRSSCRRACGSTTRPKARPSPTLLDKGEIDGFIAPRPPSIEHAQSECRLAVSRSGRRRQGLLQAHRHFSDHASRRRAPHVGRASIRGCPPR